MTVTRWTPVSLLTLFRLPLLDDTPGISRFLTHSILPPVSSTSTGSLSSPLLSLLSRRNVSLLGNSSYYVVFLAAFVLEEIFPCGSKEFIISVYNPLVTLN